MLSKKLRLTRKEFDEYFKSTSIISSDHFVMRFHKPKEPISKFAVVIPKKAISLAVRRHLIKRRVFNVIEKYIRNSNQTDQIDGVYIFILKKQLIDARKLNFNVIESEIHELLRNNN